MWAMSMLGNAKSESHRKTHPVEHDGAGRQYMFLLGEISELRGFGEVTELVVVRTFGESQIERRTEESREANTRESGR